MGCGTHDLTEYTQLNTLLILVHSISKCGSGFSEVYELYLQLC